MPVEVAISHIPKSSSVLRAKVKPEEKTRCDIAKKATTSIGWVRNLPDKVETLESSSKLLIKHSESTCTCTSSQGALMLAGCNYYELFLIKLKQFQLLVNQEENESTANGTADKLQISTEEEEAEKVEKQTNKASKFESHCMPYIVNRKSLMEVTQPLRDAVALWTKALAQTRDANSVAFVEKINLVYKIIAAYHAFDCYGMLELQSSCAQLLFDICQTVRIPNMKLYAFYFMIKINMENGAVPTALEYLKMAESRIASMKLDSQDIFECCLIKLAKWELKLIVGQAAECSQDLSDFINSEYLQKFTLNRYYLKAQALQLAAKFPVNAYAFTNTFEEFTEPVRMVVSTLKRWHRPLFPSTNTQKNTSNVYDDPVWFKFAIYKLSYHSYQTTIKFFENMGVPLDLSYIHNSLFKIAKRNCFVTWLCRLLLIGAHVDEICDKHEDCLTKLRYASVLLNKTNFPSCSLSSLTAVEISPPAREIFENVESSPVSQSPPRFASQDRTDCVFEKEMSLGELRNVFMKRIFLSNESTNGSDDVFTDIDAQVDDDHTDLIDIEVLMNEVYMKLLVARQGCNALDRLLQIREKVLRPLREKLCSRICEALDVKRVDINSVNVSSTIFGIQLYAIIIRLYAKQKNYSWVVAFAEAILPKSKSLISRIDTHCMIADIILLYAEAKLNLLKIDEKLVDYNGSTISDFDNDFGNTVSCVTPPCKTKSKTALAAPRAPKGKVDYKMEEFRDYVKQLSENKRKQRGPSKALSLDVREKDESSEPESNSIVDNILYLDNVIKSTKPNMPSTSKKSTGKRVVLRRALEQPLKISPKKASGHSKNVNENKEVDKLAKDIEKLDVQKSEEVSKRERLFAKITTFEDAKDLLNDIVLTFGNHPPAHIYRQYHFLMFRINTALRRGRIDSEVCYHLCESLSAGFRYRCALISVQKQRTNCQRGHDLKFLDFTTASKASTEYENLIQELPPSWRVCQINVVKNNTGIPDIYLSRYQRDKAPVVVKIKSNTEKFIKDFMDEFAEIKQLSNASIANKEARSFWTVRYALEKRFGQLLAGVNDTWIGPLIGMFMGEIRDETFCKMCKEMKSQLLLKHSDVVCKDLGLLNVIVESFAILSPAQFNTGVALLFGKPRKSDYEECEKIFYCHYPIEEKKTIFETLSMEPLALVLDKHVQGFPFESLPTLALFPHQIFRVPSLRALTSLYYRSKKPESIFKLGVNYKNAYYVLNPADNLRKTEQMFKKAFENQKTWKGAISVPPNPSELQHALENRDLYIFFGHGAGLPYYASIPNSLEALSIKSASFVMGCCSGMLLSDGDPFEPFGVAYRFIINGGPCYIGVLWDVTDTDIDRFANEVLKQTIPSWDSSINVLENPSFCTAVRKSRTACKLRYLIGSAPVVYGLPVSVAHQKN